METTYKGPTCVPPPLSAEAREYLQWTNPKIGELEARYLGHPASFHTHWNSDALKSTIDLQNFRGDNHYIYQTRWSPSAATYFVTAYYARDTDKLGLFGNLKEDGFFGAFTLSFDGYLISRDLLDSINQANVIARLLGADTLASIRLLDIGAGYGRLAHRLCSGFPGAHVTCADAVPLSTFLSAYYLQFRQLQGNSEVVPLYDVEEVLPRKNFDLVTNFHSFSECPIGAISWWLSLLDKVDCNRMLIIPNAADKFLSAEPDGTRQDFSHLFGEHGWSLAHSEPIYSQSDAAQQAALYPNFRFFLFERR